MTSSTTVTCSIKILSHKKGIIEEIYNNTHLHYKYGFSFIQYDKINSSACIIETRIVHSKYEDNFIDDLVNELRVIDKGLKFQVFIISDDISILKFFDYIYDNDCNMILDIDDRSDDYVLYMWLFTSMYEKFNNSNKSILYNLNSRLSLQSANFRIFKKVQHTNNNFKFLDELISFLNKDYTQNSIIISNLLNKSNITDVILTVNKISDYNNTDRFFPAKAFKEELLGINTIYNILKKVDPRLLIAFLNEYIDSPSFQNMINKEVLKDERILNFLKSFTITTLNYGNMRDVMNLLSIILEIDNDIHYQYSLLRMMDVINYGPISYIFNTKRLEAMFNADELSDNDKAFVKKMILLNTLKDNVKGK